MQVSHTQDFVSHAVIGGNQTIDFSISSSAEFFNILSSTLYKDQKLAVVREVLCNAWDAHIDSGITDKPVEVTLTEDKLIIRDFGKGIPKDMIGQIYGTYGGSTKKNDGNQTGGFGLGSKAPFAYTDHFEVTSCHNGTKTIYNMSKSSAQVQGKPGIIPIVSFATTESGLQVSIPLKRHDRTDFYGLVERIARNGDMNVQMNGKAIEGIGMNVAESNFILTNDDNVLPVSTRIMVRYGNVIYPVDTHKEFGAEYKEICEFMNRIAWYGYSAPKLIFQAPPHSISVTPSRESLSIQEHTIKTLQKLLKDFLAMINGPFKQECHEYFQNKVKDTIQVKDVQLLTGTLGLPSDPNAPKPAMTDSVTKLDELRDFYMRKYYPRDIAFQKKDVIQRVSGLVKEGVLDRGLSQTFLKEVDKVKISCPQNHWGGTPIEANDWLQRRVIGPMLTKLKASGLDPLSLYVHASIGYNWDGGKYELLSAKRTCPRHLFQAMPFLRNIVVLIRSKREFKDKWKATLKDAGVGGFSGFMVYQPGLKAKDVENAKAFFAKRNVQVIDMTVRAPTEKPVSTAPRKPTKKGVVALSQLYSKEMGHVYMPHFKKEDAARIEKPEFILKFSFVGMETQDHYTLPIFGRVMSKEVIQMFGDKGGVTNNTPIYDKLIASGVKDIHEYLVDQVTNYFNNSVALKEYWAFKPDRVSLAIGESDTDSDGLINLIYGDLKLRTVFGLQNNLTDTDKQYLRLYEEMLDSDWMNPRRFMTPPVWVTKMKALTTQMEAIPLDKANDKIIKAITENPILSLIHVDQFRRMTKANNINHKRIGTAYDILISAINS